MPVPVSRKFPVWCRRAGALGLVWCMLACAGATPRREPPPADGAGPVASTDDAPAEPSVLWRPFLALVRQHRERGTHYDGPRCPLYPSCAVYAEQAVREHGFFGLLVFVDRLFYREHGRLGRRYPRVPASRSALPRYYDPLSDVWPAGGARPGPSLFQEDLEFAPDPE